MELFCKSVVNETPELIRQGVEIRMIGDRTRFSEKVQRYLAEAEQRTAEARPDADTGAQLLLTQRDHPRRTPNRRTGRIGRAGAGGDFGRHDQRGARHGALPQPGPDRPHERRTPAQQLPALAGVLRRTLLPGGAVARFHRGGVRPCNGGIRPARPPFRLVK